MKKEKNIFDKYNLAVRKINKHTVSYQETMRDLKNLSMEDKAYGKLKRKVYSHMRAVNHNFVKCSRYDKIIKFYGTFYQVEEIGEVLARLVSYVEGETFYFEEIIDEKGCKGQIIREHDARVYANLPIDGDRDYQDCQFYGSLYDQENACLKANFSAFPYLKDYLDTVIDYRYHNGIQDDYRGNKEAIEECYLSAFRDFMETHHDFIKSKHQYLDNEVVDEYCDAFILARTVS